MVVNYNPTALKPKRRRVHLHISHIGGSMNQVVNVIAELTFKPKLHKMNKLTDAILRLRAHALSSFRF